MNLIIAYGSFITVAVALFALGAALMLPVSLLIVVALPPAFVVLMLLLLHLQV